MFRSSAQHRPTGYPIYRSLRVCLCSHELYATFYTRTHAVFLKTRFNGTFREYLVVCSFMFLLQDQRMLSLNTARGFK